MTTPTHQRLSLPQGHSSGIPVVADSPVQVDIDHTEQQPQQLHKIKETPLRPLMIYSRAQLLLLHASPLVQTPCGMPALRDWFGAEYEQSLSRKETDSSNSGSTRDRRFRREADDSESAPRPAFRSTLSQPSQMGNFKHQSLRATDRDKDREAERDRERDKEGQEKLRNLSDKYDRERLALPSSLNSLRNKDREVAPHIAGGSSSRSVTQTQFAPASSRRSDTRDGVKRKNGESSEDWRRAESHRSGRDERPDGSRKDRDEREHPRSRVDDSSKQKRDPSTTRRDRDRDNRDRERKSDRDRDESKKDRQDSRRENETTRRDRDTDKEGEPDDPRRWRDDGKRDERVSARRERVEKDRDHTYERLSQEGNDFVHDRRWDEREARPKRTSARERRIGAADDHKEKERDRDREKEPAWMDTYIPSESSTGILGGKAANGELDGIQAWKKGMKAKEQGAGTTKDSTTATNGNDAQEQQLDEIQLFKLMMKREEERKRTEGKDGQNLRPSAALQENGCASSAEAKTQEPQKNSVTLNGRGDSPSLNLPAPSSSIEPQVTTERSVNLPSSSLVPSSSQTSQSHVPLTVDSTQHIQSTFMAASEPAIQTTRSTSSFLPSHDITKPPTSRLFPTPRSPLDVATATNRMPEPNSPDAPSTTPSIQFNPPPGSRLLAFGTRMPSTQVQSPLGLPSGFANGSNAITSGHQNLTQQAPLSDHSLRGGSSVQQPTDMGPNRTIANSDSIRPQHAFAPFEDLSRHAIPLEGARELKGVVQPESIRRPTELNIYSEFTPSLQPAPFATSLSQSAADSVSGSGAYATSKGSRFAKFFDGKTREAQSVTRSPNHVGPQSSSPAPGHRHDAGGFNGVSTGNNDNRAMEDIFAMLNTSSQSYRGTVANNASTLPLPNQAAFGQTHPLQQQIHHQPQIHPSQLPNNRVEALYDSRLDDRNFMPDGLVPGLRSVHPGRTRESSLFTDSQEDFSATSRLTRGTEQFYPGTLYQQTIAGRNTNIPPPQSQYRGGPTPVSNQHSLQNVSQRHPPGLANLGRTTHDVSQFLSMPAMPPVMMHANNSSQGYNNFSSAGTGAGYSTVPQMRIAPPNARQLQQQNSTTHNPLQTLGHPGNVDMRAGQLVGIGGPIGVSRAGSSGFGSQQIPSNQVPLLSMRQQQPLPPPHIMPHLLPQHLQQGHPAATNQPAHDLMALLMGGSHRD